MRDRKNDNHRETASRKLGRPLKSGEDVDHVNMDKEDNSPANLRVMEHSKHSSRSASKAAKHTAKLTKALTMHRRGEKMY